MADSSPAGALGRMGRRLASVRARATVASVLVVAVALGLGAFGLISLLRASLEEGVETTAEAQLSDVGSLLRVGQLPEELPASRGGTFTQVVGADGTVLASSATLLGTRPVSQLHPGEDGTVIRNVPTVSDEGSAGPPDSDGPYLLLARRFHAPPVGGAHAATGPVTVYVAGSLRPTVQATETVRTALAAGLPVLVILVGALVWVFGGRALRPVEAIRAEVADITGHDLHRRVPEPASGDEIARLARTMNEMLNRLEQTAAAQRRFVADASHELRSPLAVLQATLEVALAHPESATSQGVTRDALEEARRLHRLVEDLLVVARAEEGAGPRREELVDLDEIVLRDGHRWRATSPLAVDLHRVSGGRVRGDPDQLARVVHNLLDNAARHARSTVGVELTSDDATVVLTVTDDGAGVPSANRDRIFDRFARLDEARSPSDGGAGLGLAIVRQIATAHGGTAELDDAAVGARFVVRLPAAEQGGPVGG